MLQISIFQKVAVLKIVSPAPEEDVFNGHLHVMEKKIVKMGRTSLPYAVCVSYV